MYLFDTNLISELRRPARMAPLAARWADGVPQDAVFVSVITLFEIELGIRRIERREPDRAGQLWRWLAADVIGRHADRIIAVDEPIARAAAALHVPDPRPLAPRPLADAFIAATAVVRGLTVATRNVHDFAGTGAAVSDPWSDG